MVVVVNGVRYRDEDAPTQEIPTVKNRVVSTKAGRPQNKAARPANKSAEPAASDPSE